MESAAGINSMSDMSDMGMNNMGGTANMVVTWGPECDFIFLRYLHFSAAGQPRSGLPSG